MHVTYIEIRLETRLLTKTVGNFLPWFRFSVHLQL